MSNFEVVAVYRGKTIKTIGANKPKTAKAAAKKLIRMMRKKEPQSDAFVEVREMGDFEHGDFESRANWWPDDIWPEDDWEPSKRKNPSSNKELRKALEVFGEAFDSLVESLEEAGIKLDLKEREEEGSFPITSVSREDVAEVIGEKKAEALSDERMELLARKMADDYIEQLFWDQIATYLDDEDEDEDDEDEDD